MFEQPLTCLPDRIDTEVTPSLLRQIQPQQIHCRALRGELGAIHQWLDVFFSELHPPKRNLDLNQALSSFRSSALPCSPCRHSARSRDFQRTRRRSPARSW